MAGKTDDNIAPAQAWAKLRGAEARAERSAERSSSPPLPKPSLTFSGRPSWDNDGKMYQFWAKIRKGDVVWLEHLEKCERRGLPESPIDDEAHGHLCVVIGKDLARGNLTVVQVDSLTKHSHGYRSPPVRSRAEGPEWAYRVPRDSPDSSSTRHSGHRIGVPETHQWPATVPEGGASLRTPVHLLLQEHA
ncbi:hypothetical protein NA57DRAFT_71573 [Rhizodiscina lignyota]|uniref:Uncharacterized protein n=1 Tax=Rhizodiscina lignyota TaxID=1504668 RepID=A0A9P4INQ2_9PEZI|nr:hypothetical protein NA57DRAFT_71573 [Rhizodiscina lignyota]